MQFGIALLTAADSWKVVARAEELGFRRAWFYDTQMISADPFIAMGVAAVKTAHIRLGTGVLVPSTRIAAITANSLATLNALAPGPIDFGVGTGLSARRAMGLGAVKLAEMADYTEAVMGLLRGETVEAELEGQRRKLRLLNPEAGLINLKDPMRLYLSAMGHAPARDASWAPAGSRCCAPPAGRASNARRCNRHGTPHRPRRRARYRRVRLRLDPASRRPPMGRASSPSGPRAATLLHRAATRRC